MNVCAHAPVAWTPQYRRSQNFFTRSSSHHRNELTPFNAFHIPLVSSRRQIIARMQISSNPSATDNNTTPSHAPTHLWILVNGLFGYPANWDVINSLLLTHLDKHHNLIHVSSSNQYLDTYHGIDICGQRLSHEIVSIIAKHSTLREISIIGHSMGGLISRYAIGLLFDPDKGTIAGLRPIHYISLATPHLGIETRSTNEADVPIIQWTHRVPLVGGVLHGGLRAIAPTFASLWFRRSGRHFFLLDRENDALPLMYRLSQDDPQQGSFFISALSSFETRTAYANCSCDSLVSWANASIRSLNELMHVPVPRQGGRGIVRADPIDYAWSSSISISSSIHRRRNSSNKNSTSSGNERSGTPLRVDSAPTTTTTTTTTATTTTTPLSARSSIHVNPQTSTSSDLINASLLSLQSLNWRRVDVCFRGSTIPFLGHQHMQVQRKWLNWDGMETVKTLVMEIEMMEEMRKRKRSGG